MLRTTWQMSKKISIPFLIYFSFKCIECFELWFYNILFLGGYSASGTTCRTVERPEVLRFFILHVNTGKSTAY